MGNGRHPGRGGPLHGIPVILKANRDTADQMYTSAGSLALAAISGYPSITVPAGFVSGLPIGLSFIAKPWNEKQLIEIAYAFEQTTGVRRPPEL